MGHLKSRMACLSLSTFKKPSSRVISKEIEFRRSPQRMVLNHVIGWRSTRRAGQVQGRQWAALRRRTNLRTYQPLIRRDLVSIHKVEGMPSTERLSRSRTGNRARLTRASLKIYTC